MADEVVNNDDEELELRITQLETIVEKVVPKSSTKQYVAQEIADHFEGQGGVASVIVKSDHKGPMGGKSEQVNVIFTDDDGNVSGVVINVYTDANVETHIYELLAEVARKKQLAEDVKDLPKRLDATEQTTAVEKSTSVLDQLMPDEARPRRSVRRPNDMF
jgi:hypothetical protein